MNEPLSCNSTHTHTHGGFLQRANSETTNIRPTIQISRWAPLPPPFNVIIARSSSAFQSTLGEGTGERMIIVRGSGQGVAQAFWPGL